MRFLISGNKQKSHGAKSGEYGGAPVAASPYFAPNLESFGLYAALRYHDAKSLSSPVASPRYAASRILEQKRNTQN